ncbi:MAG: T9SS type A sorting domain-containing protein [Proteiniphilum sp.]|uniref:T9SS type A sorting domain-containing protein n=1 Tax=Proteiniphilum sp. TaxID=1926877 RepID=UPI002ABACEA3|nr:T9SS type A sorting domain-containing protein [Proteiniphilum sp.]MDY9919529.1 T9SS type A sorting domain-containing protein [Proteiniphilum sp.]
MRIFSFFHIRQSRRVCRSESYYPERTGEPRSASDSENPADTVFFEETLDDTQVRIYPNPVETQMTIRVSGYAPSMQGEYSLYNITGIIVAKRRITGETTLVDMGRYPKGIYILHIILNGQPTAWRVIKK